MNKKTFWEKFEDAMNSPFMYVLGVALDIFALINFIKWSKSK